MLSVIGCGNTNRSDDGVGCYVIARLRERLGAGFEEQLRLFDAGTAGMEVMFRARGSTALILVDASASGAEPGTLFRVPGETLAARHPDGGNLHDFRWQHALHAGRQMYGDDFPEDVAVFLIEAQDLSLGLELTAPVQATADGLVDMLLEQIRKPLQTPRRQSGEVCAA